MYFYREFGRHLDGDKSGSIFFDRLINVNRFGINVFRLYAGE